MEDNKSALCQERFKIDSDIDLAVLKEKALHWACSYDTVCFLENNNSKISAYHQVEGLLAIGEKRSIHSNQNSFERLKEFHQTATKKILGFLSYDLKNELEALESNNFEGIQVPNLHFFEPEILIEFRLDEINIESDLQSPSSILKEIHEIVLKSDVKSTQTPEIKARISKADYLNTIEKLRQHIRLGDFYEINFCQEFYIENHSVDPLELYLNLNHLSRAPFSAFYKWNNRYLMCSSPERFLQKNGDKVISQPIKGTIRRGETPQEDQMLIDKLRNSKKDRAENIMIVDLVRNDLSRTCSNVKVEELLGIYSFEQVHQMISTISGQLQPDVHFTDVIKHAFPMGSMTGAPKVSTMQHIEHYERSRRGLYSGAVGYITPSGDFDLNVVIRSMVYDAQTRYLSFQVGGAIVWDSNPEAEYEECLLKAQAMRAVLFDGYH